MRIFALDTNILSYILKKDEPVISRLRAEQEKGRECIIPPVAYYEIKRGLLSVGATVRLRLFEDLCRDFSIGTMDTAAWDKAAQLYAVMRQSGSPAEEADIFIAAFCLIGGYTLVTNNTKHFEMFEGLECVNWK
ncbi:MAG: type II toxin-antitoxin system VapC family toxin [Candidatus Adiutrix sp.]|jgi:predicted nucleic acid-binding protein|nr:type II toxin-antitoxin system VapC family toxin [Candidatus Adiutrix sp.]